MRFPESLVRTTGLPDVHPAMRTAPVGRTERQSSNPGLVSAQYRSDADTRTARDRDWAGEGTNCGSRSSLYACMVLGDRRRNLPGPADGVTAAEHPAAVAEYPANRRRSKCPAWSARHGAGACPCRL